MMLDECAALRRCVGDVAGFMRDYWGQAVLHRVAADENAFADLFSMADVDLLITTRGLRPPAFRMVKLDEAIDPRSYTKVSRGDSTVLVDDQADPGRIYALFQAGASLSLQGVQEYWAPLTRFCRQLELALTLPINVNAHISPPGAQGFPLHSDDHDIFVLQVAGRKHWQVRGPGNAEDDGALDLELAAGDVLYVPRDRQHLVHTTDSFSAHLTVGLYTYSWQKVFSSAIRDILGSLDDRLPLGFAADPAALRATAARQIEQLKQRIDDLDPAALVAAAARRFWANRPPMLTGQLEHLLRIEEIDDESALRRRPDVVCEIGVDGNRIELLLGDRTVYLPALVEPLLGRMLDGPRFTPADLADHLDQTGRLVLVRRLIVEGLLEPVAEPARASRTGVG